MKSITSAIFALQLCTFTAIGGAAHSPIDLGAGNAVGVGINYASAAVSFEDGSLESYFRRSHEGSVCIFRTRSTDNGRTWTEPEVLVKLSVERWGGPIPLLDRNEELHFVIPKVRGEGRRPAVDRFIDLYHLRSHDGRTEWTAPKRVFEGYCGAIQGLFQLRSGRIIAPFADWLPNVPTTPPTGPSETTAVYSDDGGATWRSSPARLTAPCFDGYNGANYGACEPTIIELNDGRAWMLLRTQTGVLYESFSPDGVNWSKAAPSRFPSSNSPAFPIRLADGRIVLFWNNCVMPDRVDGDGVYAGRDALHAAISSDDGETWRGFREVYRDPTRNGTPPKAGDRGTAYPHATLTKDGKVLLVSGQGTDRRRRFLVDPDWLLETEQTESFDNLDAWHLFKGFGPVSRWWRDRKRGAKLVAHPNNPANRVLLVRRPDELPGDGAVWNFPAGSSGSLTLRLRTVDGFRGGCVSLTDRMYNPCDDNGDKDAPLSVELAADGDNSQIGMLNDEKWHTLKITWSGQERFQVAIDDNPPASFPISRPFPNGLSYLRLRSTAPQVDPAGLMVESVKVTVD